MPDDEEEFYTPRRGGRSYISILSATDDRGNPTAVFAEKCNEGDDGAISRVNKNDKTVWEKHHGGLRMHIKSVWIVPADKSEYGMQLCIASDKRVIQVPWKSNHARKFIAVCHNIDLDEKVLFEPYRMPRTKDGKPVLDGKGKKRYNTGWTIKQGGSSKEDKLEEALDMSKDGPVPPWKKLRNGDWDTSDQDEYLENYLQKWIDKNELGKQEPASSVTDEEEEEEVDEEEEEAPTMKKARGKVVSSKPSKKAQAEMDEEDEEVPY
jgi:hypothetical protein